jgi:hypothetical protein
MGVETQDQVESDWSYIYIVVPSAVSFLTSVSLLIYIIKNHGFQKQFYQFMGVFIFFNLIQCSSWFLGPRYHTNDIKCLVQEYMFQFGCLGTSFLCVVIAGCVQFALILGRSSIRGTIMLGWYSLCVVLLIISISLRTADIFCPFDTDHELYYVNYNTESRHFTSIIGYFCVFILPIFICFVLNIAAIMISIRGARKFNIPKVQEIVYKLRIVPVLFFLCMVPIVTFFLVTVFAGIRVRALLQFGGASLMSCGWMFAVIYFMFRNYEPKGSPVRRMLGSESNKPAPSGKHPFSSDVNPIVFESELVRSSQERPKPASSFMSSQGPEGHLLNGSSQSESSYGDEEDDYFVPGSWK